MLSAFTAEADRSQGPNQGIRGKLETQILYCIYADESQNGTTLQDIKIKHEVVEPPLILLNQTACDFPNERVNELTVKREHF
jgi:hypothetical protein